MAEETTVQKAEKKAVKKEKNPYVWPDLPFMELMCMIFIMLLLILWSLGIDAPLGEIATPSRTENPAKAPWYFIGLQEILVYFDPWYAGVVLPSIIIGGLMAVPYLDNNPKGVGEYNFSARKFAWINFLFGYAMWMVAIVVGQFMRGPSWFFFWPWEYWDPNIHHADVEMINFSFTTGMICLVVYSALFYLLPIVFKAKIYKQLDGMRYFILMTLMALMYAVPIKIVLRQLYDVRYILVTPWFNI